MAIPGIGTLVSLFKGRQFEDPQSFEGKLTQGLAGLGIGQTLAGLKANPLQQLLASGAGPFAGFVGPDESLEAKPDTILFSEALGGLTGGGGGDTLEGGGGSAVGNGSAGPSGGLADSFTKNPLGSLGLLLESFIAGSEGRTPQIVKQQERGRQNEFERRRLEVLESGERRAGKREDRADKKALADAKATEIEILARGFNLPAPVRAQYARALRGQGLGHIADALEAPPEQEADMQGALSVLTNLPEDAQKKLIRQAMKSKNPNKFIFDSLQELRAQNAKKESKVNNATLISGIGVRLAGGELPPEFPKLERELIEEAEKAGGPEGVQKLLATANTRVQASQPTQNRLADVRAREAVLNTSESLLTGILGSIEKNRTAFGAVGAVKGTFQNVLGVLQDTGDALFPRLQSLVADAQSFAERNKDPGVIALFAGFDPTIPDAKMVGNALALQYARALRGSSERVTRKEIERQEKNFDFTRIEGVDQLEARLKAVTDKILPALRSGLTLERGVIENPGAAVEDLQELEVLKKKFGLQ